MEIDLESLKISKERQKREEREYFLWRDFRTGSLRGGYTYYFEEGDASFWMTTYRLCG